MNSRRYNCVFYQDPPRETTQLTELTVDQLDRYAPTLIGKPVNIEHLKMEPAGYVISSRYNHALNRAECTFELGTDWNGIHAKSVIDGGVAEASLTHTIHSSADYREKQNTGMRTSTYGDHGVVFDAIAITKKGARDGTFITPAVQVMTTKVTTNANEAAMTTWELRAPVQINASESMNVENLSVTSQTPAPSPPQEPIQPTHEPVVETLPSPPHEPIPSPPIQEVEMNAPPQAAAPPAPLSAPPPQSAPAPAAAQSPPQAVSQPISQSPASPQDASQAPSQPQAAPNPNDARAVAIAAISALQPVDAASEAAAMNAATVMQATIARAEAAEEALRQALQTQEQNIEKDEISVICRILGLDAGNPEITKLYGNSEKRAGALAVARQMEISRQQQAPAQPAQPARFSDRVAELMMGRNQSRAHPVSHSSTPAPAPTVSYAPVGGSVVPSGSMNAPQQAFPYQIHASRSAMQAAMDESERPIMFDFFPPMRAVRDPQLPIQTIQIHASLAAAGSLGLASGDQLGARWFVDRLFDGDDGNNVNLRFPVEAKIRGIQHRPVDTTGSTIWQQAVVQPTGGASSFSRGAM